MVNNWHRGEKVEVVVAQPWFVTVQRFSGTEVFYPLPTHPRHPRLLVENWLQYFGENRMFEV